MNYVLTINTSKTHYFTFTNIKKNRMLPFLAKLGFWGMAMKTTFSGAMSLWMCSNIPGVNYTNFSLDIPESLKTTKDKVKNHIAEAAKITGYECGSRCEDIVTLVDNFKDQVNDISLNACKSQMAEIEGLGIGTCELLLEDNLLIDSFTSIQTTALQVVDDNQILNPKSSTLIEYKSKEYPLAEVKIKSDLSIFTNKMDDYKKKFDNLFESATTVIKSARRHVGWLAQGKLKTLEIINEIITMFITNIQILILRDLSHMKSFMRKQFEDYELCTDYISSFFSSLFMMTPFLR